MNERIFELSQMADEYADSEYAKKHQGSDREQVFREHFARLIVLECMATVTYRAAMPCKGTEASIVHDNTVWDCHGDIRDTLLD